MKRDSAHSCNLKKILHSKDFGETPCGTYCRFETWWRRLLHKILLFLIFLLAILHVLLAVTEVQQYGLRVPVLLTMSYAVVYSMAAMTLISISVRSQEVADFLNATSKVLASLTELKGKRVTPFSNYRTMLEIIPMAFVSMEAVIMMTLMSVCRRKIAAQVATALEKYDLLPEVWFISPIGWRLILVPLEFIHCLVPALAIAITGCLLSISAAADATIASTLSSLPLSNPRDRMKMYTLYMALQLYNQILCRAIHYLFPCAVLTVTFSIIYSLYVSIVGTALPFYLHILFPVVAVIALTMNSILTIDATKAANLSGNAIELVKSYDYEMSVLLGKSMTSYFRKQELA